MKLIVEAEDGRLYAIMADIVQVSDDSIQVLTPSMMSLKIDVPNKEAEKVRRLLENGVNAVKVKAKRVIYESGCPTLWGDPEENCKEV